MRRLAAKFMKQHPDIKGIVYQIRNDFFGEMITVSGLLTGTDLKAQLKYDFGGEVFLQTRHYHIERNEVEEDIKYLEAAERKFWQQVQRKEQPALILPEI